MESSVLALTSRPAGDSPFADLSGTAENHFRLCFYAAVYRMTTNLRRLAQARGMALETLFERYPAISGYFSECVKYLPDDIAWEEGTNWWEAQIARWERQATELLPLAMLRRRPDSNWDDLYLFLGAGFIEEDARFGGLFAELQAPLDERRPSLATIGSLFGRQSEAEGRDSMPRLLQLAADGFLTVLNRENPRSDWIVRIPDHLWEILHTGAGPANIAGMVFHPSSGFDPPEQLIFPGEFVDRLVRMPQVMESHGIRICIVRGSPGSDRLRVTGALARLAGCNLMEVDAETLGEDNRRLGPLCTLLHAVPAVLCTPGPGETYALPSIPGYAGPVGVLLGEVGGLSGRGSENTITLTVPAPDAGQRLQYWRRSLPGQALADVEAINERFFLPPGHIRKVAQAARAQATMEDRERVTCHDVRRACGTLNRQLLDTLAEAMPAGGTWEQLVTGQVAADKLHELERRCKYRERLLEHLGEGFARNSTRGVRALFTGPSGTGKTLAARILAAELDMDLYRVDLAAVINKYVGETEKNLHRILSVAEELDVVLLLDEGDALLGTRTEVRTANDRYANLETNYLLQKLESYQGIVITTTNLGENIDKAFERRMDLVVEFLPPEAEERWHIWQLHLPEDHQVDEKFLNNLALRCELTGGQIRNAAQLASLLSLENTDGQVSNREVDQAVRGEYRKAGATCPLTNHRSDHRTNDNLNSLLDILG